MEEILKYFPHQGVILTCDLLCDLLAIFNSTSTKILLSLLNIFMLLLNRSFLCNQS